MREHPPHVTAAYLVIGWAMLCAVLLMFGIALGLILGLIR